MAKKKTAKKPTKKITKRKPRLDFAQQALANVEKIIGGKLADGMNLKRK
jgi:hypothetical protein